MPNKMIIHDVEQGSPEWLDLKRGKFSGSRFKKLFMGKTTKGYNELITEIAIEIITGKTAEMYVNQDMRNGTLREPDARLDYEIRNAVIVDQVGFVELNEWVGVSPDGLIGEYGMLEIKSPRWTTHTELILNPKAKIDSGYIWQMQGCMWVTGRSYCDYYDYYPGLKPYQERVVRDEEAIEKLKVEVDLAIELVEKRIKELK